MRKIILQDFVTVDGFAADPSGGMDFIQTYASKNDRSFQKDAEDFLDAIDTMLLGANTYKLFAGYWPEATEEGSFAEKLNSLSKVVVSTTLQHAPWGEWEGADIIRDNMVRNITALKERPGKDIVLWGSLTLGKSLIKEGLIDEYQFRVCPVVLGKGQKPFPENEKVGLKLQEAKTFDKGLILLKYQPQSDE